MTRDDAKAAIRRAFALAEAYIAEAEAQDEADRAEGRHDPDPMRPRQLNAAKAELDAARAALDIL